MTKAAVCRGLLPLGRLALTFLVGLASNGRAEPQEFAADRPTKSSALTLQAALQFALEHNPVLAAQRKQLGIAAARVVIAETYPFNPILENRIQSASGPQSAGITNKVLLEHLLLWEVEVRHQGRYRRQGAAAALSRTEWEIAFQEQTLAIDVTRFYTALLYRQEKLQLLEESHRLNERFVEDVRRLVGLGKLRSADLILAQTEVTDSLDLVASGQESLTVARQDLNKILGSVSGAYVTEGVLEPAPWNWEPEVLGELALTRRADLRARQMAVAEAAANIRLAAANRYGNPIVGPAYTYDSSRVSSIGIQVNIPIPVANTRRGEMLQSEAERSLAIQQLRSAEFTVKQDVTAALARLNAAERRAEQSRAKRVPDVRRSVEDMEKLFQAGEPGVDVLRVIDVRRKLLKARDGYIDSLWTVRQARIDVAAATGEPALDLAKPAKPTVLPVRPPVVPPKSKSP